MSASWKTSSARILTKLAAAVGLARGTTRVRTLSRSLYTVTAPALDGRPLPLSTFDGQVTLIVNVASQCGFTPQYRELQALYDALTPRGFSVLAFPTNEFGAQEPGTADDIRAFCDTNYQVTFPLFARTETKRGPAQSPVYALLEESGKLPQWNFSKYVIGRNGQPRAFFPTQVAPDARQLRDVIEAALSAPR